MKFEVHELSGVHILSGSFNVESIQRVQRKGMGIVRLNGGLVSDGHIASSLINMLLYLLSSSFYVNRKSSDLQQEN